MYTFDKFEARQEMFETIYVAYAPSFVISVYDSISWEAQISRHIMKWHSVIDMLFVRQFTGQSQWRSLYSPSPFCRGDVSRKLYVNITDQFLRCATYTVVMY